MKIAISGSHCTGKTTLLNELNSTLGEFEFVEEPFYLLEHPGAGIGALPGIESFEEQLELSIKILLESNDNVIFERCPLDFIAYINSHTDSSSFDIDHWINEIKNAMEQLDILVFVPIEEPDVIGCHPDENPFVRNLVNSELQDLIYHYKMSCEYDILEVSGNVQDRVEQLVSHIQSV